jgi:hypothetical protein
MPFRFHLPLRARRRSVKGSGAPLDAAYYQALHEQSRGYQRNNWLADDAALLAADARSVIELRVDESRRPDQPVAVITKGFRARDGG